MDDTPTFRGSGYVNWPTRDPSGEPGTIVVAAVFATDPDPFVLNFEAGQHRVVGYELNIANRNERDFLLYDDRSVSKSTRPVLAWVQLGSANATWAQDPDWQSADWLCTRDDLTSAGLGLVADLEAIFGRPVALLTLIDT